jgi:hypothetical protein|tara:strand:- start:1621 stop:2961 length:1341 start_codon:yes stop_codon:yes gene_type:complete
MSKSITSKTFYILFLIAIVSCTKEGKTSNGLFQGEIESVKTFGGLKNETANDVISTIDGGYAVIGYTQSNDGDITDKINESYDYWVLKFDENNQLQWSNSYGGTSDERGQSIIQTNDSGYFISGFSKSSDEDVSTNFGSNDYWVAKLDATGNILWEKSFGFSGTDQAFSSIQTLDGGYLITGTLDVTASSQQGNDRSSLSSRHAGGDYWAIKLDASGTKQWRRFFGGSNTDSANDVIQTEDSGFLMVGLSDSIDIDISNNKGTYDFWVVKINSNGELVWEKSYGGEESDQAYEITKTSDGNFVITGDTRSDNLDVITNYGSADIWTIKISPLGEIIWKKTFGGSSFDSSKAIIASRDGGFYIAGNSRSINNDLTSNKGNNDVWVLKISESGNLEWQKSIGGTEIDLAFGIAELNNNSIVVVGESWSSNNEVLENKGFSDLLIINIK